MIGFELETVVLDLPALTATFSRRLREAGLPVVPERAARFAAALALARPVARRRLYWIARTVFVSERGQLTTFDAVFAEVFGRPPAPQHVPDEVQFADEVDPEPSYAEPTEAGAEALAGASGESAPSSRRQTGEASEDAPVPVVASDEEVLRGKRFDALDAAELARLVRLMSRLALSPPPRRTRRYERRRHGRAIDLRRTLRRSRRTGGDPVSLAHRERRTLPRRLVLLCDISGSMEPYTRAYMQFMACAARVGPRAEAFVFATRLTRVTRPLAQRNTERALARAAAAAPDWSSGTRIGEALKAFNDRHGRRGMARGAVVVILSDGWERGDPTLVAREMERLGRLAHRIVWVNPRAAARGFSPSTGGMAAALPHCDVLLSGHNFDALDDVATAIAGGTVAQADWEPEPEVKEWASATPVPGSSVAMPSGHGPSRGRTTPGWNLGGER